MAVPHASGAFGDLLDPRFQRIFYEDIPQLDDMIPELYEMVPHNGRDFMSWSEVGALQDWPQFTGTVDYQSANQGYDVTMTYLQFASGIQVERQLFEDDQFNIMDQRPANLRTAYDRTRQTHAARPLNNAFSFDTFFYNNSENVALCSNSHTTNHPTASTATGFDNLVTIALTATAVASARIQFRGFRDDAGNRDRLSRTNCLSRPICSRKRSKSLTQWASWIQRRTIRTSTRASTPSRNSTICPMPTTGLCRTAASEGCG